MKKSKPKRFIFLSPALSASLKVSILKHKAHDDPKDRQTDYQHAESGRSHEASKNFLSGREKTGDKASQYSPNSGCG